MNALLIEDMNNTFIEHSFIINYFVVMVGKQIKDSLCRVLGDGVQYQWHENDDKTVIPDAIINCNIRDRKNVSLTGIPRMVMEVLSNEAEEYDRGEKMEIYRKVGVSEYWIVDWRKSRLKSISMMGEKMEPHIFICIKLSRRKTRKSCSLSCFQI